MIPLMRLYTVPQEVRKKAQKHSNNKRPAEAQRFRQTPDGKLFILFLGFNADVIP